LFSTATLRCARIIDDPAIEDCTITLREHIAQQALALPPEDRAFLAELLEQSLTGDGFASPELAAEWAAEVRRRINAYDHGETQAVDAATAMREMRQGLADRRAGNGN
jgi:putative addiction module component (TIGR02574 family)